MVTMRLPEVMLAAPAEDLPPEGSDAFEARWDGFRCLIARTEDGSVLMRSRKGTDLTTGFPEIASAARQDLPHAEVGPQVGGLSAQRAGRNWRAELVDPPVSGPGGTMTAA
ncbi:hypothetical protein [Streptomyces sp. NPDC048825]|uniref:hypothetical protein n=1 Tax=Streptomyces sp. NPDC048825 TaxID=3365592 RepID=UPI0037212BC2